MNSRRANSSSNVSWIRSEYFNFDTTASGTSDYMNWAKHLFPLVPRSGEWNAGNNAYSQIEVLKKPLAMFASGIQTRETNIVNAAIILASDADSAYLEKLLFKNAMSQHKTNLLVIGNLSSPISLLIDVSCNRFLYKHISNYFN